MDSVRFGRALGFGARAAAKTLVTAVDAATSPNPSAKPAPSSPGADGGGPEAASAEGRVQGPGARAGQQAARAAAQVRQTRQGLKQGGRQFGEAVWGPFVKFSGVLWLEVTGVFFGVFALFAAGGAWKMRGDLHDVSANHGAHLHFLMAVAMATLFGYFCVSSFVKANRRSKRS